MSVANSQEVILGHQGPRPRARSQVAMRTCWECVLNKALLNSEDELKLSEATVSDGSVALLWLKLFFNNM